MVYDPIKAFIKMYEGYELIIPQVADIDYDEADEIILAVIDAFSVGETKAKEIIENSIKGAFHIYTAIRAMI